MLKRLKFQYKLFIPFSVLIFLIFAISGIIFYSYTVSVIEKNVADNQKQTIQKIQEQFDGLLSEMDRITIAVNSSEYIMDLLKNIPYDTENNYFDKNIRTNDAVKNILFSFISPRKITGRISLITKNYDYTDLSNKLDNQNVNKEYIGNVSWVHGVMASKQYKTFLPPHQDDWSENKGTVFSVVRPLRDNYDVFGLVEVSRDIQDIDNICTFKDSDKKANVIIFDDKGNLIYENFDTSDIKDKRLLYNDVISTLSIGSYEISLPSGKTNLIASFSRLSNINWTVVQFEDMETFKKPIIFIRNIVMVSYILVFIIVLLLLYIITRSITKPIRGLKDSITMIDMENLKLELNTKSTNNEITLLSDTFQKLLSEVRNRTEKLLQSHSRETKAQMLALQAQMNPHFLYNTLAVIGAFGQKKGNTEVAAMCADLSSMLRYTITSEKDTTIKSEVKHVESYLKLMSRRLGEFFEYHVSISDEILEVCIPKLFLEPIVENAFIHGFTNIEPPWVVWVNGYVDGNNWYIKVIDNGRGFDTDVIIKIKSILKDANEKVPDQGYLDDINEGGLGLINVFMRLRLFFNGNEYIDFFNSPEGGAVIVIGGPINY